MKLMVMDGHGGGIGAAIIKGLRESIGNNIEVLAVGTNSIATSRMMKAGANRGATGQNAVVRTSRRVDIIMGPIAILMANSMMGEMTESMASAISSSEAVKILLPLSQERINIVGVTGEPLPHLVDQAVAVVSDLMKDVDT